MGHLRLYRTLNKIQNDSSFFFVAAQESVDLFYMFSIHVP